MAHERARDGDPNQQDAFDGPGPLRALLVSEALYPETTMTVAPTVVQRLLWATVGRAARSLGRSGIEQRFLDAGFWQSRVEQPRSGGDGRRKPV